MMAFALMSCRHTDGQSECVLRTQKEMTRCLQQHAHGLADNASHCSDVCIGAHIAHEAVLKLLAADHIAQIWQ